MSSNKKRKLDEHAEPKSISAFAARKQLQKPLWNADSSQAPPSARPEGQNSLKEQDLSDDALVEASSLASLMLHQDLKRGYNGFEHGVGPDDHISDSPDQEENDPVMVTESKSRDIALHSLVQPNVKLTNFALSESDIEDLGKGCVRYLENGTMKESDSGKVAFSLSPGQRLIILGEYGLHMQNGQISLLGATISASDTPTTYLVSALASHSLPVIRFFASDSGRADFHICQASRGLRRLNQLSPLFGKLCHDPENWKRDLKSIDGLDASESSFKILYSTEDVPPGIIVNPILSPPEWNEAISVIASGNMYERKLFHGRPTSSMICGPKSSGKSTFARLLSNHLLSLRTTNTNAKYNGVAYLDLDPGQPEYSPPGHLSLVYLSELNLGPPYSHPTSLKGGHEIIRAHSIAALSPATDPLLYLKCVLDLLGHYRGLLSTDWKCPLIINTYGWVLGSGLETLVEIIKAAHPTEIMYMSQDGPPDTVKTLRDAAKSIPVLTVPSQVTEHVARTGAQLRNMQALSYFHVRDCKDDYGLAWNNNPLSSTPPWEVKYGPPASQILGIMCVGEQPSRDMLKDTIDGTLLSVIVLDDMAAIVTTTSQQEGVKESHLILLTPEKIPYLNPELAPFLDPTQSQTIGMALLRGIDVKRKRLQLLTPIAPELLKKIFDEGKKIVLLSGKLDTPGWAYMEELYKRPAANGVEQRTNKRFKQALTEQGDECSSERESDHEEVEVQSYERGFENVPWIDRLQGHQGRGVGARVWRVRRSLGKIDGERG